MGSQDPLPFSRLFGYFRGADDGGICRQDGFIGTKRIEILKDFLFQRQILQDRLDNKISAFNGLL
jgi:hypothetical protein